MRREWLDSRCVLCCEERVLTGAHLIPKAVGGRLEIVFMCKPCNEGLGHRVEKGLKSDPRIRHAIEVLRDYVPELAGRMRSKQQFIAKTTEGVVRAIPDGGGYRILHSAQPDGTWIKDAGRARQDLATTLRRRGRSEDEIQAALVTFDAAPVGVSVMVAPGYEIRKGNASNFTLPYSEPIVPDECPLAIAYQFLPLALGRAVYLPALEQVRSALQGDRRRDGWHVESLRAADRSYEPWHGLAIDAVEPHLVVQIRLFGEFAWRVHFTNVSCSAGTFVRVYRLDLVSTSEEFLPGELWQPAEPGAPAA